MTLRGHLIELRNRLFLVGLVMLAASTVAYVFQKQVIGAMLTPLDGQQLQYLTPGGGFSFIFTVIIFVGLTAAIPLLIYQLYAFLRPTFSEKARTRGIWLLIWSSLLLVAGVLFGYFYAVPGALHFLYGFADEYITSSLTAASYLDFVIKYTMGLGILFQIPLIMIIIHWITPLKPMKLFRFERWVILLAFILGAIITPTPDPINQLIVAVPIIIVYQAGLIAVMLDIRKSKRATRRTAVAEAPIATSQPATSPETATPPTTTPQVAPTKTTAPQPPASTAAPTVSTTAPVLRRSIDGVIRTTKPHDQLVASVQPETTQATPAPAPSRRRPYIDGIAPRRVPAN